MRLLSSRLQQRHEPVATLGMGRHRSLRGAPLRADLDKAVTRPGTPHPPIGLLQKPYSLVPAQRRDLPGARLAPTGRHIGHGRTHWRMTFWRVREFHDDDLDAAVAMWDDSEAGAEEPLFRISELIAAVRGHQPAVVATVGDEMVGNAVATVSGDRAWLMRLSLGANWRHRGLGSTLLMELERRIVAAGAQRINAVLAHDTDVGAAAMEHQGFSVRPSVSFYQKSIAISRGGGGVLEQLGGQLIRSDTWERIGGMGQAKQLIERRVILPLSHVDLSDELGLEPPRSIVLFGPPGTGKTTFAKGIAGRLGWPFIELFPSRLAGESPAGLANALRESFALVHELSTLVLFIDEVEEIAGERDPGSRAQAQGVTNEMLKLIPLFREQPDRLLVCATNSVRALDPAFLRHGRFDYLIPVGPPDAEARMAIWDRYLGGITHDGDLDMDAVVRESELFTPADIEFAARHTTQIVFERVALSGGSRMVTTDDVLQGISETRPTLTPQMVDEFSQDIVNYARI